ncbi:GNAT family N-acetyltransferase [Demequina flava]|uniref:GNAT family N-acetyltransferase n=1 Tax=Demequina flava TaxID=1095025 RepID=UPI00078119DA|nr:GNAT family protein [Demequina flava]
MTTPDLGVWAKPTLTGDRVTLRPYASRGAQAERDVDAVWEMAHDAEGNDLTATTATFERAQIDAWVRSRAVAPERLDLVVVDNATGEVAGEVVLNEPVTDDAGVAVAANYRIALRGPAWYGRGLGTEAGQLVVDHAFATMGLQRLTLEVLARNPRARRSYERLGFVETSQYSEDGEDWIVMAARRPATRA